MPRAYDPLFVYNEMVAALGVEGEIDPSSEQSWIQQRFDGNIDLYFLRLLLLDSYLILAKLGADFPRKCRRCLVTMGSNI